MNVVREINKINDAELSFGLSGASWHDEYKDSAYIFVGGLNFELTEGDVITIFSQYGEVMDVNMPRDKDTGKAKGFAFLMYEDQRSTVLAVDNLNGAKVLERTLRVDHVKNYKQPKSKGEDGEWQEAEEQSFNARPEMLGADEGASDSDESSGPEIDPEDPMYEYLVAQRKEEKAKKKAKKAKSKAKHKDETPEQRKARKAKKKEKKERKLKSSGIMKGVEDLLQSLERDRGETRGRPRSRSRTPTRRTSRSRSPYSRRSPPRRRSYSRSRSPKMRYRSRTPPRPRYSRSRSPPPNRDERQDRKHSSHDARERQRS